jgi:hypothetical protein
MAMPNSVVDSCWDDRDEEEREGWRRPCRDYRWLLLLLLLLQGLARD